MKALDDFIYISDRKVNSYAAQIPKGLAGDLSAEISANLGVMSFKLSSIENPLDRVSRMLLVRKFIETHYDLGTTELPGEWVGDELSVQSIRLMGNESVFLLLGRNVSGDICALAGSAGHVIGNVVAEKLCANASYFSDFAESITDELERFDQRDAEIDATKSWSVKTGLATVKEDEVCSILYLLLKEAKGVTFKVAFLARRVFESELSVGGGTTKVQVLTPLYVSTRA